MRNGKLLTPALIDCHTHIVYGGHRALEFELRLNGASYAEVAKAGGGIVATVSATRLQTVEQLVEGALARVDALIAEGVSLIEVKSGYGLDIKTELRMLRAARAYRGRASGSCCHQLSWGACNAPQMKINRQKIISKKPVFLRCA
jgi:imidazolonepropionase